MFYYIQAVDKLSPAQNDGLLTVVLNLSRVKTKSSSFFETFGFKPFLTRMSSKMILFEVSASSSHEQGRQNLGGFVYGMYYIITNLN